MQSGQGQNQYGQAGGLLGAGLGSLFSNWQNPANGANQYLNQIPGQVSQYMNPYIGAGQGAIGNLQGQYGNLLNNPGGELNSIGANYHQSPGFQFALQQALQGANQSSAAGGMAGSPQSQQQNMGIATQLGNQDYNNWLQQATGLYGQGLQGEQGMAGLGLQASTNMSDQIAQMLAQQGAYSYAGQNGQNQRSGNGWGSVFGGLGDLAGLAGLL